MKKNKIIGLITALIAVIGFKDVSAATAYVEQLPDTVTRAATTQEYKFSLANTGIKASGSLASNVIEFLSEDSKYLLYCSDRNNDRYTSRVELTKENKLDYKIAYIVKSGHNQKKLITGLTTDTTAQGLQPGQTETATSGRGEDMANLWITQVAIWNLQNTISSSDLETTKNLAYTVDSHGLYYIKNGTANIGPATLWQHVDKLVAEANSAQNPEEATLSITGDTDWTKSDNIAKSGLITIGTTSNLAQVSTYGLSLENAPEGTRVYKEDGTDITDNAANIPGGTKIYITIDNNKISKTKEYNFKLNVKGNIKFDVAYQYVDKTNQCGGQTCQPSVLVGPESKEIAANLDFKIIPDTAGNISKSIYYIGFIILLSGAGIIYANIRPRREV